MHSSFILVVPKSKADSVLGAESIAESFLEDNNFAGQSGYWGSGVCDWFSIGAEARNFGKIFGEDCGNTIKYDGSNLHKTLCEEHINSDEYLHSDLYDTELPEKEDWLVVVDYHN